RIGVGQARHAAPVRLPDGRHRGVADGDAGVEEVDLQAAVQLRVPYGLHLLAEANTRQLGKALPAHARMVLVVVVVKVADVAGRAALLDPGAQQAAGPAQSVGVGLVLQTARLLEEAGEKPVGRVPGSVLLVALDPAVLRLARLDLGRPQDLRPRFLRVLD